MKLNNYIISGFVALMGVAGTSCTGDLDLKPNDPNSPATCTATT